MSSIDPCKANTMWVWHLGDPSAPKRVGAVSLIPRTKRSSFRYDNEWVNGGFPLSPNMPLQSGVMLALPALEIPGALDDAMPDQWGQIMIRLVDRPARRTSLDFLYFGGDRRFGALGISTAPDVYAPYGDNPLLTTDSMEEANELIQRVIAKQPLNERERQLLNTGNMGGAHPKMLIAIGDDEWIAKFPKGDSVDLQLIENASLMLAKETGINVAESRTHRIPHGHIMLTKRFDRSASGRIHALSARTMIANEGDECYATISGTMRKFIDPLALRSQQKELFTRMVFNILIENGDDHTKNHAFLRNASGTYDLSPAYDVLPQMAAQGNQAIPIDLGQPADDLPTALNAALKFGLSRFEASEIWKTVAKSVSRWKEYFGDLGVSRSDIEELAIFIDAPHLKAMRDEGLISRAADVHRG